MCSDSCPFNTLLILEDSKALRGVGACYVAPILPQTLLFPNITLLSHLHTLPHIIFLTHFLATFQILLSLTFSCNPFLQERPH